METEIELTKCPDCQVDPGDRHEYGSDVTPCRFTVTQQLMCGFEFGGYLPNGGINIVENRTHECEPCIWTGEWPGVKVCRENNWYTAPESIWGYMEDLNCVTSRAVWNPEIEDWEARASER
jgi:hypothetical protein